jgi:hypothetical protein
MPADSLSAYETALRSAIAQGRYTEAQFHLSEYCREVAEVLQSLPAPCPEGAEIADRACQLLAWAGHMTLSGKAHMADQLRQLNSLRRYQAARPRASAQTCDVEA